MYCSFLFAVLLCLSSVNADMSNDGEWIDDVSGNPVVMGMVAGPPHHGMMAPAMHQNEDGQWIDDVSGNPVVMGMVAGPPHHGMMAPPAVHHAAAVHSADGEWADDVSGNIVAMGMDFGSQDSGWTGNAN